MSVYEFIYPLGGGGAAQAVQKETHLYGSSRLGILNSLTLAPTNTLLTADFGNASFSTFTRGEKIFELSNHLGNVLVTVSDKKIGVDSDNDEVINYYTADVVTANDYYPFGMTMPGRKYSQANSIYRYGFNGQEKSDEVNENSFTAEFWQYDSRIGIRWNLDPKPRDGISDYSTFDGNPIQNNDPDGDCPNCVAAAVGTFVGGIIGGAIEAGTQLYKDGKVSNWKAVGGAAVQGAITGGVAGFTGGASLGVTTTTKVIIVGSSAVAANVIGGTANRAIQGKKTTGTDIATDALAGALGAGLGALTNKLVKGAVNKLSNSAKGKLGETVTKVKYALRGYADKGKAIVPTGEITATGKIQVAKYDYSFKQLFSGNMLTVESKFNKSGFTSNQSKALIYVNTPGGVIVDRTTSQQFGTIANSATQSTTTGAAGQLKHR